MVLDGGDIILTVTVEEIRFFLKGLPEDFVGDETIVKQIDIATWIANKERSDSVASGSEDFDNFVLLQASYMTVISYMQEMERGIGVIPPNLIALENELRNLKELGLEYIRRGDRYSIPLAVATVSDSIWDYRAATTIKTCTAN